MNLPQLPHDKSTHVIYGAAIFAAAHTLAVLLKHPEFALIAAAAATTAFGIGKELLDFALNERARKAGKLAPHGVEVQDALATLAGGALVALPLVVR